jgi:hypothetical protein
VLVQVSCVLKRSVLLSIRVVSSIVLMGLREGFTDALREAYPVSHSVTGELILAFAGVSVLILAS